MTGLILVIARFLVVPQVQIGRDVAEQLARDLLSSLFRVLLNNSRHWNEVLRLVITLMLRHSEASCLFGRLNFCARQYPL